MARLAAVLIPLLLVGAVVWYVQRGPGSPRLAREPTSASRQDESWLEALSSANPRDAEAAAGQLEALGDNALPVIRATLNDPRAGTPRRKAALKACSILGKRAAPLVIDVAAWLPQPEMTAEAAVALSFMGPTAFAPLRAALSSADPVVRREALRSIGKLKERAPLDSRAVVPLLIDGMADDDNRVRAVAATYLGIIHDDAAEAVPALIDGLQDEDVDVRRASATALGSFGGEAQDAFPALRRASGDPDPDVAREAGRALVKLQGK